MDDPEAGDRRRAPLGIGRQQSAVLVPVPAVEKIVDGFRARHDPVASAGVPAHITLVVPWVVPTVLDEGHLSDLGELLEGVAPWDFELGELGWFGQRVLWLAPRPAEPFTELTIRVAERFGTPPWADQFDEVVPHLTVGQAGPNGPGALMAEAARLRSVLPRPARAEEVWVMVGDGHRWSLRARFALTGQAPRREA